MRSWDGFAGYFVVVSGCLGEAWAVFAFCRRLLSEKALSPGAKLFFPIFAAGRLALIILNRNVPIPYILLAFADHILLLGLVSALFPENPAKKLFAASPCAGWCFSMWREGSRNLFWRTGRMS